MNDTENIPSVSIFTRWSGLKVIFMTHQDSPYDGLFYGMDTIDDKSVEHAKKMLTSHCSAVMGQAVELTSEALLFKSGNYYEERFIVSPLQETEKEAA